MLFDSLIYAPELNLMMSFLRIGSLYRHKQIVAVGLAQGFKGC